ncbi:hypothetical protein DFH09DRAFT_1095139 [Mycena vulgaris]|nr:hypothetical protein DFH09DRAFT_1095139 [Mycena vulgaris]
MFPHLQHGIKQTCGVRGKKSPFPKSIRLQHLDIPDTQPYKLRVEPLPGYIFHLPPSYFDLDVRSTERFQSLPAIPYLLAFEIPHYTGQTKMIIFMGYFLRYRIKYALDKLIDDELLPIEFDILSDFRRTRRKFIALYLEVANSHESLKDVNTPLLSHSRSFSSPARRPTTMVTLVDVNRPVHFSRWDSERYFEDIRYELDLFRYHMAHSFVSRSAFTSSLRELWRTTIMFQEVHAFPCDADVLDYFRSYFPVFHLKDDLQRWGYVSRERGFKGCDVFILRELGLALRDTRHKAADHGHNYRLSQEEFRLLFHVVLSRIVCSSITTHFFSSYSACDDDNYLDQFERSLWGGSIQIQWIHGPTWRMADVSELFIKTLRPKSEVSPIGEAMARRICKTLEGPYLRPYPAFICDDGSSTPKQSSQYPPSLPRPAAHAPPTRAPLILSSSMPAIQFLSIHDV